MIIDTVDLSRRFEGMRPEKRFAAYRRIWAEAEQYKLLTDFPLHLDIELSGKCNLKCSHCFQNGLIRSDLGFMQREMFARIIDEGVPNGLCAVKLQIRGESLLHPEFFDLVEYAKNKGVLDVQVTTNGTLLSDETIEKIFASRLDAVILSVDAHHEGGARRKSGKFVYSQVEAAVSRLLERRRQLGLKRPWIRLRASIDEHDPQALQMNKAYLKNKFPLADIYIVGRIHNFRDDQDAFPDLKTAYGMNPCAYLMQRLAVFWDGSVTTCCMDYNNRFDLGHVDRAAIQDIWLSETMNRFRSVHFSGNREKMEICRHCHACLRLRDRTRMMDTTRRHIADYDATLPDRKEVKNA